MSRAPESPSAPSVRPTPEIAGPVGVSALAYGSAGLVFRLRAIADDDRYCWDDWSASVLRQAADKLERKPPGVDTGGPEIWNVVAWGDVRECRSTSSVMQEVREAVELGCRTISIERQGAPNIRHEPDGGKAAPKTL